MLLALQNIVVYPVLYFETGSHSNLDWSQSQKSTCLSLSNAKITGIRLMLSCLCFLVQNKLGVAAHQSNPVRQVGSTGLVSTEGCEGLNCQVKG